MNSFEKKPINGGTPAIENIIKVMRVKKKLLKVNPWKDWSVLKLVNTELKRVQKRTKSDKL